MGGGGAWLGSVLGVHTSAGGQAVVREGVHIWSGSYLIRLEHETGPI